MTVMTLSVPHTPLGRSAPFWRGGRPGKGVLNHLPGGVKIHTWPMAYCPVTSTFKVGYWRRSTPPPRSPRSPPPPLKHFLGVKWSPKLPRRRAANGLADYRCERDAFIAELAQAIGGSVLVVEPNTAAMSMVPPDMEATECPN
jgi:hypothetical protein